MRGGSGCVVGGVAGCCCGIHQPSNHCARARLGLWASAHSRAHIHEQWIEVHTFPKPRQRLQNQPKASYRRRYNRISDVELLPYNFLISVPTSVNVLLSTKLSLLAVVSNTSPHYTRNRPPTLCTVHPLYYILYIIWIKHVTG